MVTHSSNAITLSTELLALSSHQKRKRIWLRPSPPLGSDWLHHCNPGVGSVGSAHGPLFAPALCTQLLTDSDKESELGKKRALFVTQAWMVSAQGEHHNQSNVSVYRFPREMRKKMLMFSYVCPPFPFVFFTFCQPDSFIRWMNNSESSEAVMFGRQPRKKLPSFLLFIPLICNNSIIQLVWVVHCAFLSIIISSSFFFVFAYPKLRFGEKPEDNVWRLMLFCFSCTRSPVVFRTEELNGSYIWTCDMIYNTEVQLKTCWVTADSKKCSRTHSNSPGRRVCIMIPAHQTMDSSFFNCAKRRVILHNLQTAFAYKSAVTTFIIVWLSPHSAMWDCILMRPLKREHW